MKLLTLIRHAKSSWDDPWLADAERPLNARGRRDLPLMAARMRARGPRPDRLLHSSAVRTRLTAAALSEVFALPASAVVASERLYDADLDTLLQLLREQPDSLAHLMLVGHNPGLLQLAQWLCEEAPERLPTAAIVQFELPLAHWAELTAECARRRWYDYPKKHPAPGK